MKHPSILSYLKIFLYLFFLDNLKEYIDNLKEYKKNSIFLSSFFIYSLF